MKPREIEKTEIHRILIRASKSKHIHTHIINPDFSLPLQKNSNKLRIKK